jgi:hypothetical protein
MQRIAWILAAVGCVVIAWSVPALAGSASPGDARLTKRLSSTETKLARLTERVASLESQVRDMDSRPQPSVRVTLVQGNLTLAAPGVIPAWYTGQATCPPGTTVSGGGASFDGVYGNQPVLEQSTPRGNSWFVSLRYMPGSPQPPAIGVYATCVGQSA